ncbi:MAG TPA: fibronectin type III domain-containing protein [Steroidobacteraceae bacterium]|nr:fibronectin type III domain-containing protein [Steroidobacteraceae bacterium]
MTNAKRGRGSRRGIYFCAAVLGLALSGCGGGGGAPAGSAATAQNNPSSASSLPAASSANSLPAASSAAVTLNWTPPTENTDGTALTNLSGYDIHYGTASGNYTQSISVANAGIATYVVDNLTPGKYYFSVAAVNSDGTESPLSAEVTASVSSQ